MVGEVLADYNIMFRKKMHFGQIKFEESSSFHIMCITQFVFGRNMGSISPEEEYSVFGKIQEQVSK